MSILDDDDIPAPAARLPVAYDPARHGAHCNRCLLATLREGPPVPPEVHEGASFAIVGEGPGLSEVEQGAPFVGASGQELTRSLMLIGVHRTKVSFFNSTCCRPPDGKFEKIEKATTKANKAITAAIKAKDLQPGHPLWLHPVDACRPRLMAELEAANVRDLLPVGAQALRAFTHERRSILEVRGGMMDGWLAKLSGVPGQDRYVEAKGLWADNPPMPDAYRVKILPSVHPAFVLRARRWTRVFRSDLLRGMRWFAGLNDWVPPKQTGGMGSDNPTPSALWLFDWLNAREAVAWDTETDGLEPLTANLRCVSFGDDTESVVIPLLSKDGKTRFYPQAEERRVREVLKWWLASGEHWKFGWNSGYYDRLIAESSLGVTPNPKTSVDGIMLHRLIEAELPHNLGFVASLYAQLSPSWKASRTAVTAENDAELHTYAGTDGVQTFRVIAPLLEHVAMRQQHPVLKYDRKMQHIAGDLHRIGMKVDVCRRDQHEALLLHGGIDPVEAAKWEKDCRKAAKAGSEPPKALKPKRGAQHSEPGRPSYLEELRFHAGRADFNPASVLQVRSLLYDTWNLPVPRGENGKPKLTKGGDPSTDDEACRSLLIDPLVQDAGCQRNRTKDKGGPVGCLFRDPPRRCPCCFLEALRRYREAMKLWGTYLKRLVPMTVAMEATAWDMANVDHVGSRNDAENSELALSDDDLDEYEEAERAALDIKTQKEQVKGYIWPDGRVRSSWNAHGTTVGRLSASAPNCLNIPGKLRDLFVGMFVGADADQIHMRIIAGRWRVQRYLDAFDIGADPHSMTAFLVFGELFRNASGFPPGRWVGALFVPAPGSGKWSGLAKQLRQLSKTLLYASAYKAQVETVFRLVTSTEDTEGNLIYANETLEKVRFMHANLIGGAPEIAAGWAMEIATYKTQGFVTEPILGRRFDFLDGIGASDFEQQKLESKIVNAPILGAEAGHMNIATSEFVDSYPYDHPRCLGLVHQNYDSMCAETEAIPAEVAAASPEDVAAAKAGKETGNRSLHIVCNVARLMEQSMTKQYPGLPGVTLTATAQWGENLKDA